MYVSILTYLITTLPGVRKYTDSPHHAGGGTAAFADQCSPSSP